MQFIFYCNNSQIKNKKMKMIQRRAEQMAEEEMKCF